MWRGQKDIWLTQDQLERRASGRRRYNAWRQFQALYRRMQVAQMLAQGSPRGTIAARLGVSPSTVSRDIDALLRAGQEPGGCCPLCLRTYDPALPHWS